VASYLTA